MVNATVEGMEGLKDLIAQVSEQASNYSREVAKDVAQDVYEDFNKDPAKAFTSSSASEGNGELHPELKFNEIDDNRLEVRISFPTEEEHNKARRKNSGSLSVEATGNVDKYANKLREHIPGARPLFA